MFCSSLFIRGREDGKSLTLLFFTLEYCVRHYSSIIARNSGAATAGTFLIQIT
jgi:hypothetical protein